MFWFALLSARKLKLKTQQHGFCALPHVFSAIWLADVKFSKHCTPPAISLENVAISVETLTFAKKIKITSGLDTDKQMVFTITAKTLCKIFIGPRPASISQSTASKRVWLGYYRVSLWILSWFVAKSHGSTSRTVSVGFWWIWQAFYNSQRPRQEKASYRYSSP